MQRTGLKCPGCGSSDVVEDDLYAQSHLVCVDCGFLVSEGSLANDPVGGSDVSYSHSTQQTKRQCANLIKGLQRIRALCRVLRINSEIERSSETYFQEAYNHKTFINVALAKKEVLAGCCVLICCRMHNWPITMGTIAYLIDSDPSTVGPVYQEAVKTLNISVPTLSVTDIMEAHCQEYKITSEHVPDELAADMKELTKRALALVELAAESWIVTGRRPVPVMMAATYLSWQSLEPTKLRLKMNLAKFCHITKVDKSKPAMKRVSEIKGMLCKLGKEIPWQKQEVTVNNVMQQVEDILSYRFVLMRKALMSNEDTQQADLQQCDARNNEIIVSKIPEEKSTTETGSSALKTQECVNDADADCDEPNWSKQVLFAPPCVVNPKKRKRTQSNQMEVTGNEDISDSEIDSYIRTPQEVRDFAKTQKLLSLESED
ncbi:transcription factor IIIB 50 kDa subunit [Eucyclogobius newberryi]|uniref:transcription factor IIIB 50 kDa subunit n=1 Tax=Eucyclogobius newberryi TaxID=166745 RepID=UPI003B5C7645